MELRDLIAMARDGKGTVWMGSLSGLYQFKDGRTKLITEIDGIGVVPTGALELDQDKNVWIGTGSGAVRASLAGRRTPRKDSVMGSATLFFMASTVGVLFGWQPMPDGSARYEYVVQLDPELVATLEAGESIPISSRWL